VRVRPRGVRSAVLAVLLALGASAVAAQEPEPGARSFEAGADEGGVEGPDGDGTKTPPWAYSPHPRPIRESVDRAVARVILEHSPCGPAGRS
jgi:hypothetical protein